MMLDRVRETWLGEIPTYQTLCGQVEAILRRAIRRRGIRCLISSRTKTIDSLLKKALKKKYADPYNEIQDKSGVRVVCTYMDSIPAVEEVIQESFEVLRVENKALDLSYDRLGYSGIHFESKLRQEDLESCPELIDKVCEIQLLTEGQHLWANQSHTFLYKPVIDPADPTKLAIFRLQVLLDLYDSQVAQARADVLALPGFQEAFMLEELEKHFYRFTAQEFDRELSLYILGGLKPLFSETELAGFEELVAEFVTLRESDLIDIYKEYSGDAYRSPILFQPEAIAIFMCLERDRFSLTAAWQNVLPVEELQRLADVWVVDLGDID